VIYLLGKRGRPKTKFDVITINVVIPEPLLEELDLIKKKISAVSRSETIRWLIYEKFRRLKAEGRYEPRQKHS